MTTIKWTRDKVIRGILEREAAGQTLSATQRNGRDTRLYDAARRAFGSWANALTAAGVLPERVMPNLKWTPSRILVVVRNLSKRKRPLTQRQLRRRYGNLVGSARRAFGSWPKAAIAAGVDPAKLRRDTLWTREKIIEAILVRALRGDRLNRHSVRPGSLVDAAERIFGSWPAAKEAAGLDPYLDAVEPRGVPFDPAAPFPGFGPDGTWVGHRLGDPWPPEEILFHIRHRFTDNKRMNARAVHHDDSKLYTAARKCFGSWVDAVRAAGLDPAVVKPTTLSQSRQEDAVAEPPTSERTDATKIAVISYESSAACEF